MVEKQAANEIEKRKSLAAKNVADAEKRMLDAAKAAIQMEKEDGIKQCRKIGYT